MSDVLSWIRLPGPFLVGHRGFPAAARENTPPSFEAALETGCDGIELDVRLTADGIPVVHHDASADGPDGPVALAATAWADLAVTRFASPQGFYRIHALVAVLRGLSGRCLLNVEVKPPEPGRLEETAERVHAVVRRVRPRESLLVSSFDAALLGALHDRDRSLAVGFLFASIDAFNHLEEDPVVDRLASIHPRHDLIDARLMKRARERGLQVHAWTVDDPAETRRLHDLGVTAVITNRPDRDFGPLRTDGGDG